MTAPVFEMLDLCVTLSEIDGAFSHINSTRVDTYAPRQPLRQTILEMCVRLTLQTPEPLPIVMEVDDFYTLYKVLVLSRRCHERPSSSICTHSDPLFRPCRACRPDK